MSEYQYLSMADFVRAAENAVPSIVLSYGYGNLVSRVIVRVSNRWKRDKHEYSHAMALVDPGVLASQELTFRRVPLRDYLQPYVRLKLWTYTHWTYTDMWAIRDAIREDLADPWYLRIYDAPGLVGQWLGNTFGVGRSLNLPFLHYCSPRVMKHFGPYLRGLRKQPSPAEIDRYCTQNENWKCKGVFDPRKDPNDE